MDTRQIQKILLSDIFVSVLPRDQLSTEIDRTKAAAFVVNTDSSDLPGSQLVALFYDGVGHFAYFDSFGLPPLHADILNFIEKNSNRPFSYNSRTLQVVYM
jgi:hypothetical protein